MGKFHKVFCFMGVMLDVAVWMLQKVFTLMTIASWGRENVTERLNEGHVMMEMAPRFTFLVIILLVTTLSTFSILWSSKSANLTCQLHQLSRSSQVSFTNLVEAKLTISSWWLLSHKMVTVVGTDYIFVTVFGTYCIFVKMFGTDYIKASMVELGHLCFLNINILTLSQTI